MNRSSIGEEVLPTGKEKATGGFIFPTGLTLPMPQMAGALPEGPWKGRIQITISGIDNFVKRKLLFHKTTANFPDRTASYLARREYRKTDREKLGRLARKCGIHRCKSKRRKNPGTAIRKEAASGKMAGKSYLCPASSVSCCSHH